MSSALDIALSGMRAAQAAIDVSAHNVANASTDGYARQRVNLAASTGYVRQGALIGGGVEISSVQRISDRFVARQIRQQVGELGYYEGLQARLADVESVFNETGDDGIQNSFSEFYSGLANIASNPEDRGIRVAALNSGQLLASKIQSARQRLTSLDSENRLQLDYAVQEVNTSLDRLADLNAKIASAARLGNAVGDLQNERDHLLEQVSKAVQAQVTVSQDDGAASISIQGKSVVLGNQAAHLVVNGAGLFIEGDATPLSAGQGEIGAMLELRDTILPGYLTDLDTLSSAMITDFNTVHAAGFGLDGSTGLDLFTGTDSGNISINSVLLSDPGKFAASGSGEVGDITNIEALLQLRSQASISGYTHEEYYAQLVGSVGAQMKTATDSQSSIQTVLTSLYNRRDSVAGVSLDEEMTNLIRLQQAYNAAARVVSMVDELTRTVVDLGR